jgi:hypothetical protein
MSQAWCSMAHWDLVQACVLVHNTTVTLLCMPLECERDSHVVKRQCLWQSSKPYTQTLN